MEPQAQDWMLPEQAPFKVGSDARFSHVREAVKVTGSTLLALKGVQDWSPDAHKEALRLNRTLIQFRLPYGLRSREVLQQLNEWKQQLNFHL